MELKSISNFVKWALKYKKQGLPIQYYNDESYIDWFVNYRPFLKQFENIHQGEDCFIIGNGPSLNKTNLSLLNDFHTFGMNKIHLIFEKHPLQLSYHVAVNPLVIEQIDAELRQNLFNCPSFLSFHNSQQFSYDKNHVLKVNASGSWSFHHSLLDKINEGYTVTFVAMQIAFFMGFKRIFLVGVDHNFQQQGKPNEQQEFKGEDVNHFHPDYFKGMQWHLADLEGNEASYALAKHQFHTYGREIYDATIDGKLTIYEKISFEDALEIAKKKKEIR